MNSYELDAMKCGIPDYMIGGVIRYLENGIPPGDFLSALINNDLKETFSRADDTNIHCIKNYVMFFYNHAPSNSWGHKGAVDYWTKMKGKEGD